jgi:hypothetical protein
MQLHLQLSLRWFLRLLRLGLMVPPCQDHHHRVATAVVGNPMLRWHHSSSRTKPEKMSLQYDHQHTQRFLRLAATAVTTLNVDS